MILLAISLVAFGSSCNWQDHAILDRWEVMDRIDVDCFAPIKKAEAASRAHQS
jgi:hypothetical protein